MKEQIANHRHRRWAVWLLVGLLGAGVLWVCAAQAQSADASRLYVAGRRAVLDGRWNEAVLYLTAAVDRRPREGGEVVVYGKHLEPYLPHFLLGVAFYELGALDAASKAWRESESQGYQSEVRERRHKTLADLLQRYGSSLAATEALEKAEETLDALHDQATKSKQVRTLPEKAQRRLFEREVEDAVAEAGRLRADLRPDRPGRFPKESRRTPGDVTVSNGAVDRDAISDQALALLGRVEELVRRDEELTSAELDTERQQMAAKIRAARCEWSSIDDLLGQLYDTSGAAELASSLLPGLIERCGLDGELLIAAARHPSLYDVLGSMVESGGERGAPPDTGDAAVRRDLELLGQQACPRPAMARMARWLGEKALGGVPAPGVERALASAFERCGEPEIAATYRLAGSTGTVSNDAESDDAVADPLAGRTWTGAEAWAESELRLDAGVCDPGWRQRLQAQHETELDQVLTGARLARNCGRPDDVAAYLGPALADRSPGHSAHFLRKAPGRQSEILQSLADWYRQHAAADFYSSRHALIFAASDYGDGARGWPDLPGASGDAEAVRAALLAFGFEQPRLVRDPSGRQMRREMERFIEKYADDASEDRLLLIYWAGHGAVLDGQYGDAVWSTGFLVPVDAPYPHAALDPDSSFTQRAVSMDVLEQWAREMRPRHALFMLDSCYSGSAFRAFGRARSTARIRRLYRQGPRSEKWDPLARYRLPARLVVASSSADQRAADRSQFRRSFVDWLEIPSLADYRRDRVVSGHELCLHLAESTREASGGRQSPSCQSLAAPWDQGDVIFPVTRVADRHPAVSRWVQLHLLADLATWRTARGDGSPEAWAEYLRHYPAGRFAELAAWRLGAGSDGSGSEGAGR